MFITICQNIVWNEYICKFQIRSNYQNTILNLNFASHVGLYSNYKYIFNLFINLRISVIKYQSSGIEFILFLLFFLLFLFFSSFFYFFLSHILQIAFLEFLEFLVVRN